MKKSIILCIISFLALFSCNDPYEGTTYQVYDLNPISTYLDSRPEVFSEWVAILRYADLYNAINQASENFTAFVPDNEAVLRFYQKRNVGSIEELGQEFANDLVKFHIIHDSLNYNAFIENEKLLTPTLSEDYLTVDYGEGGNEDIRVNGEARVLEFAIKTSNGYVYVLEDMMTPLLESITERFEENADQYSIFNEILELTSWKDSLHIIYDEYRQASGLIRKVRRNYTVLAVPDESFRNSGIYSVSDLIQTIADSEYGEPGTNYTAKTNQLFLYMAYHILSGKYEVEDIHSLENSTSNKKIITTLSGNVLQISEEENEQFYLNYEADQHVEARIMEEK
ncbi:MAG: fasciclin domain-containing protein, partial [Rikenellaceae bacterium]|nr:fasciclin domain-containing protein [Rikenellaceae bacterium]